MFKPSVRRIVRIGLTVRDLDRACAFYRDALGFEAVGRETRAGPAFAELTGLEGAKAEAVVLRLGAQEIELTAFEPPGRPYPEPRAANDPWFQHFAIVTADMGSAHASLVRNGGFASISDGGPVTLPPATGSIVAYKFRDPFGHPLELSYFPPGAAGPAWRDPPAGSVFPSSVFRGIDHSAIAVQDVEASVAFYTEQLGFRVAARQVNTGPTQDRLDGLKAVEVDIVALEPPDGGVHMELLGYRSPKPRVAALRLRPNDVAATRLVMEARDVRTLVAALHAGGADVVSKGVVQMGEGQIDEGRDAALIRDPDGHLLELRETGLN